MTQIQNLVEYYDELFSTTQEQKDFYKDLISTFKKPAKLLSLGCATGAFENYLSQQGCDVTGIESSPELLRSANLKRRNQLMSVRFFQMKLAEVNKFLTKSFYDIVYCHNSRLIFCAEKNALSVFYNDCKNVLSPGGAIVLHLVNIKALKGRPMSQLPSHQNVRVKLFTELWVHEDKSQTIVQNIETGNGKMLSVMEDQPVYIPSPEEVESEAKKTGFKKVSFYSDFNKSPFTGNEDYFIAVIS
ncbi:bifunctional 2-polyprenyl-6-hydroxyphenol methylase/3-demethylubiquinol 3-O-methyltransferase UbiG [Treponema sp.]|uniref:class I SAM-dependent methyltransferase n=1 Tax=Treponema sp. TaxID=166 RepID=UPI0025F107E5|nr:class I SAM-dependent methyltransferase [Treponema sp.]MCR5217270.1 class I SAM-dependent methyltransferase [Treponema sp.]